MEREVDLGLGKDRGGGEVNLVKDREGDNDIEEEIQERGLSTSKS